MNYEGWKITSWPTPVSDAPSLRMERLTDTNDGLEIILQDFRDKVSPRYAFRFSSPIAYRNINESFRNALWRLWKNHEVKSTTAEILGSDLLLALRQEPAPDGLRHFIILTEDDVVEIVSLNPPEIARLSDSEGNKPAGKSQIRWK